MFRPAACKGARDLLIFRALGAMPRVLRGGISHNFRLGWPLDSQASELLGGAGSMNTFEDRQKGFERKFALDEELRFKSTARRNKLLGLWAAEKMGLSG